jgi:hypothetical protein
LTPEVETLLRDKARWNNDLNGTLRRWLDFLRIAAIEASWKQFNRWVFRVVDAMALALPDNDIRLVLAVIVEGAEQSPRYPGEPRFRWLLQHELDAIRVFYGVDDRISVLVGLQQQEAARAERAKLAAETAADADEPGRGTDQAADDSLRRDEGTRQT